MSLRLQAEKDLGFILEGDSEGFTWTVFITDPNGNRGEFSGFSNDVSALIDPDTNQAVSGRMASIAIRTALFAEQGVALPRNISDRNSKPWVVEFDDINGSPHKFKCFQSNPDRALGLVTCLLEVYK